MSTDALGAAALDRATGQVAAAFPDRPDLVSTFDAALRNSLETTVRPAADGSTFVVTGDIPAMWLRDSAAQVEPYLRFAAEDPQLRAMLAGVVARHAAQIGIDPYANAFNESDSGARTHDDRPAQGPWVWERKYELDSLCYPIRLAHTLWQRTGSTDHLDPAVHEMLRQIIAVLRTEQRHETDSAYRFERLAPGLPPTETLPRDGVGALTTETGLVWSGFRPSDDACTYGYLIPANMFAVVSLGQLAEIARTAYADESLAADAEALAAQIRQAIDEHGTVEHPRHGRVWAYEVDGLGNQLLMDDANVPSLLSAPYLGFCPPDDPTYLRTRALVLSSDNPFHYAGTTAAGIGSPHTYPGWIWPIALSMQGITATDHAERLALIDTLLATTAGTGLMHESFDVNEPANFSRPWFGWANSLFAEFVLRTVEQRG
jgi:uncharacterized protein